MILVLNIQFVKSIIPVKLLKTFDLCIKICSGANTNLNNVVVVVLYDEFEKT